MDAGELSWDRMYARLELGDDAQRYWEILVSGERWYLRYGRIGNPGRTSEVRTAASATDARAEAERRIAEKLAAGYQRVDEPAARAAIDRALGFAILGDPDREDGYLVLADWLQTRGDPRGEWIILTHVAERKHHDARVIRSRNRFWREHGRRMLPAPIRHATARPPDRGAIPADRSAIEWRWGYVARAWLGRPEQGGPHTVRELASALLYHPSSWFLRELSIGDLGVPGRRDYGPILTTIAHAAPPALRALHVGHLPHGRRGLGGAVLGDVTGVATGLPALTTLRLAGDHVALEPAPAPSLRTFELHAHALEPHLLEAVDRSIASSGGQPMWPRLRELTLSGNGQPIPASALPRLLAGGGVNELRSLALPATRETSALWDAVARSPLLARLERLDFSYGDLVDDDVAHLLAHREDFRHLRRLSLHGNHLSSDACAELSSLAAEVTAADQRRRPSTEHPPLSWQDIETLAPDYRSYMAALDVVDSGGWRQANRWASILWGRYHGTEPYEYEVFFDEDSRESACTCPSRKLPCKHALALLVLELHGDLLPLGEPPLGLVDHCRSARDDKAA